MTARKAERLIRLREWAKQLDEHQRSGIPISQWCKENGIGYKTYFYRKRRVQEEVLDALESEKALLPGNNSQSHLETPVFAALPVGNVRSSMLAVTLHIGTYTAEIHNGADTETVEGVLRTLSSL